MHWHYNYSATTAVVYVLRMNEKKNARSKKWKPSENQQFEKGNKLRLRVSTSCYSMVSQLLFESIGLIRKGQKKISLFIVYTSEGGGLSEKWAKCHSMMDMPRKYFLPWQAQFHPTNTTKKAAKRQACRIY